MEEKKVTESYPNIELGSQEEYNTILRSNNFVLRSNPFRRSEFSVNVALKKPEEIEELLLSFGVDPKLENTQIVTLFNNKEVARNKAESIDMPYIITDNLRNTSNLTLYLEKPKFYDIFNWNEISVQNLKLIEKEETPKTTKKEFTFQADKENLEETYIDLIVSCQSIEKISPPIKITINGYILSDANPTCTSRDNTITAQIPLQILNETNNLKLETTGYYKLAYNINKIYYNDKDVYYFTMNNFNDIIDVVMYGDFDQDPIDVKLNGKMLSLNRNEVQSIIAYLRYGTNELQFLTKPLEIEDFTIEKSEYLYG